MIAAAELPGEQEVVFPGIATLAAGTPETVRTIGRSDFAAVKCGGHLFLAGDFYIFVGTPK